MKIQSSMGLEQYRSYQKKLKDGEGTVKTKAGSPLNTDKVTISDSAAAHAEAAKVAPSLAAEVEEMGGAQRLQLLQNKVQNGEYNVAAEDVADAILNFSNDGLGEA